MSSRTSQHFAVHNVTGLTSDVKFSCRRVRALRKWIAQPQNFRRDHQLVHRDLRNAAERPLKEGK